MMRGYSLISTVRSMAIGSSENSIRNGIGQSLPTLIFGRLAAQRPLSSSPSSEPSRLSRRQHERADGHPLPRSRGRVGGSHNRASPADREEASHGLRRQAAG